MGAPSLPSPGTRAGLEGVPLALGLPSDPADTCPLLLGPVPPCPMPLGRAVWGRSYPLPKAQRPLAGMSLGLSPAGNRPSLDLPAHTPGRQEVPRLEKTGWLEEIKYLEAVG